MKQEQSGNGGSGTGSGAASASVASLSTASKGGGGGAAAAATPKSAAAAGGGGGSGGGGWTPRDLFKRIVDAKTHLVVHNGLLDLAFLYQGLHGELPPQLDTFVADVTTMFGSVTDTKYVAEFHLREKASFLEYLFRKCQRQLELDGLQQHATPLVEMTFPLHGSKVARGCGSTVICPPRRGKAVTWGNREAAHDDTVGGAVGAGAGAGASVAGSRAVSSTNSGASRRRCCQKFAEYGHCDNGLLCDRSHDLDLILDQEEADVARVASRKRKRGVAAAAAAAAATLEPASSKARTSTTTDAGGGSKGNRSNNGRADADGDNGEDEDEGPDDAALPPGVLPNLKAARSQGHRAGFDAYMTGYVLAATHLQHPEKTVQAELANKLYLGGKPRPLLLVRSAYAKPSGPSPLT